LPSLGRMGRTLTIGKRTKPSCIVVMFHGLNDSAECCSEGVAQRWADGLKGCLVVVPQSPDRSIWSGDPGTLGYDWLRQRGVHDTSDNEANIRELQRVALARARHVEAWIRDLLKKHGLKKDKLILTGFSQGSILAAVCAARLNALGAVACGGVTGQPVYSAEKDDYVGGGWMRWEELLPKKPVATRFCAVNGTEDSCVPRRNLEHMLSAFDCHWHWDRGVGHDFPDKWYEVALKWMKQAFGQ